MRAASDGTSIPITAEEDVDLWGTKLRPWVLWGLGKKLGKGRTSALLGPRLVHLRATSAQKARIMISEVVDMHGI